MFFSDFSKSYNATGTARFRWTQILDGISDDQLDDGIDDNGGGESPDDEEVLVSLQTALEQIFCIFSIIKFVVSIN